jgi:hypothetical protein
MCINYKLSNDVRQLYAQCFKEIDELPDEEEYEWSGLTERYPAINSYNNIQGWMSVLKSNKYKKLKNLPDKVRNDFHEHCLKIKKEKMLKHTMVESKISLTSNGVECQVFTGDCTILANVLEKREFGKLYFNDDHSRRK